MKQLGAIAYFLIGALCLAAFYPDEVWLAVIVAFVSFAFIAQCGWKNLRSYFIAVVVGGFCENLAVWIGGWDYSNAAFLPAPLWLPLGWGFSIIAFEEAFGKKVPAEFSVWALPLAILGTIGAAYFGYAELGVVGGFLLATLIFFKSGFYRDEEFRLGVYAAVLGTFMEALSIFAGNWDYTHAMLRVPIWLPLCWFNAYLIMRRIIA